MSGVYAVRLLMLQRKVRYPGELAPEVVAAVDDYAMDDNPDWWPVEVTEWTVQGSNR